MKIKDSKTGQYIKGDRNIAPQPIGARFYEEDYYAIKDLPNRSEIIREAVAQYLKKVNS